MFWKKKKMLDSMVLQIEELHRLVSEKHEMIVSDRKQIEELYRLASEKHKMIVSDRKRIEELYRLVSEKHEMIMYDRKDICTVSKYALLSYWCEREKTKEQKEVIDWVTENGIQMYPNDWTPQYLEREVQVNTDADGWLYIVHRGKKLFFPKGFKVDEAEEYYKFLTMEQDKRSPHCYFDESYLIDDGESAVLYDVGAAEGIISLEHIDKIKHVYLFECNRLWAEALEKTFEPYRDKVTIINKLADSYTDDTHIALKDLSPSAEKCVIKIDVEGYEMNVLAGIDFKKMKVGSKLVVCVYHHQEDEAIIGSFLQENGLEYEPTRGYLLSNWGGYKQPFLRRGLLRGIKK